MTVEIGKNYKLRPTRWGDTFKVRKVTDKGIVCGFYLYTDGRLRQGACIKISEFEKLII